MQLHIKPHWVDMLDNLIYKAGKEGILNVMNCGYYRFNTEDKTITPIAEWSLYPSTYNGIVFEGICEALGFSFNRNDSTVAISDPTNLLQWADLNLRNVEAFVVLHPGYFEGTWPEAERDFN